MAGGLEDSLSLLQIGEIIGGGVVVILIAGGVILRHLDKRTTKKTNQDQIEALREVVSHREINGFLKRWGHGMVVPWWVKLVHRHPDGRVEFRMYDMNSAYTDRYKKTASEYIGKTDYEVWSPPIAKAFYENDYQALNSKGHIRFKEMVTLHDGREVEEEFHKVYVDKVGPDGKLIEAIVGWSLEPFCGNTA